MHTLTFSDAVIPHAKGVHAKVTHFPNHDTASCSAFSKASQIGLRHTTVETVGGHSVGCMSDSWIWMFSKKEQI